MSAWVTFIFERKNGDAGRGGGTLGFKFKFT